jgi:elongation factor Ts
MVCMRRPPAFAPIRFYSRSAEKPPLKLVAELRKLTEVPITKAREALAASNNDVSAALQWLQADLAVSGAKKATKVAHRAAREGLVCASVLSRGTTDSSSFSSSRGHGHGGVRAALVELNCETDFVARNALFGRLVADVTHTAAFLAEPLADSDSSSNSETTMHMRPVPLEQLLDAPLLSASGQGLGLGLGQGQGAAGVGVTTVGSAIRDAIAKLGENVVLQRAVSVAHDPVSRTRADLGLRVVSYTHGGVASTSPSHSHSQGRIGALALVALKSPRLAPLLSTLDFREELERIERAVARQIVGFDTTAIRSGEGGEGALYEQPFMMLGGAPEGETVGAGLARWAREKHLILDTDGTNTGGLEVVEFVKWTVGECLDVA